MTVMVIGVMVLYADDESFTLMTPQGHMFAGWITFSATERDGETVAQAQLLMRAFDPIFEAGHDVGGHGQEDPFWSHTLRAVASHFGAAADVDTQVVCVDKRRQWSKWTNVWHSSAIVPPATCSQRRFAGSGGWRGMVATRAEVGITHLRPRLGDGAVGPGPDLPVAPTVCDLCTTVGGQFRPEATLCGTV